MIKNKIQKSEVQIQQLPSGYVLNPTSGKLIKVNGKQYNQLLRNNMIEQPEDYQPEPQPRQKSSKIVSEGFKSQSEAYKHKERLQQNTPAPDGKIYSISNNKKQVLLKNKKSKSLDIGTLTEQMSRAVLNVNKKLSQNDDLDVEDENNVELFKSMINQELLLMKQPKQRPPPLTRMKSIQHVDVEESDDDDDDDDSDDE